MKLQINNESFNVEVMNTDDEKRTGMQNRDHLDGCMLFNMGKGIHKFWMKGCIIPLDIIFVSNNKITTIHRNCQPPHRNQMNPKSYTGMGDVVLEFMSGKTDNLKIGDRVYVIR